MWFLPPLAPNFEAALRDVRARGVGARVAAADRLARPEPGRGEHALDALSELATDADARVRAAAVRALPELGDRRAMPRLLARLDDADALVRELAVVSIAALGGSQAQLALRNAMESRHPELRFQAVASYVETSVEPELAPVEALLEDVDAKVRAHAARSLARFGKNARLALLRALHDAEPGVRREAAIALARVGESAGKDELAEALRDPELLVDALDAIGGLDLREHSDAIAPLALGSLRSWAVKVAAARALARLRDPRGTVALERMLTGFLGGGRSYAAQVVGELRLRELTATVARLAARPRGTDPEVLVDALAALLPASDALAGLQTLARGHGEAALRAQSALLQAPHEPDPDFPG